MIGAIAARYLPSGGVGPVESEFNFPGVAYTAPTSPATFNFPGVAYTPPTST